MPKFYRTGRTRKFVRVYRKKRYASRTILKRNMYSVSARAMHMPLPNRMCVTLRAVDNNIAQYQATAGFDGFVFPLYFPGCFKDNTGVPAFAGGFLQLIQMYSQAWVKKVKMTTRMMAVSNGANVNLNLYTLVVNEQVAEQLVTSPVLADFQDNSNTYNAKKYYLSAYPGANNYQVDVRTVDVSKFVGYSNQITNRIYNTRDNAISTPSAGEALNLPMYVILARNQPGVTTLEVAFEHVFDFDIEFHELKNLPQQITSLQTPTWARRT